MTDTQMMELLQRATRSVQPNPDLVDRAVAEGRRRRRMRNTGSALALAAVVAGAGAVAAPVLQDDPPRAVAVDQRYASAPGPVAPEPASPATPRTPHAADDLAATLAGLLEGRGEITFTENWHGPVAPGTPLEESTLPDGTTIGRGATVRLDGDDVLATMARRTGDGCGEPAVPESDCRPVPGGFLEVVEHLDDVTVVSHEVTYHTGDLSVSVAGGVEVLSVADLAALAQDPTWLT